MVMPYRSTGSQLEWKNIIHDKNIRVKSKLHIFSLRMEQPLSSFYIFKRAYTLQCGDQCLSSTVITPLYIWNPQKTKRTYRYIVYYWKTYLWVFQTLSGSLGFLGPSDFWDSCLCYMESRGDDGQRFGHFLSRLIQCLSLFIVDSAGQQSHFSWVI